MCMGGYVYGVCMWVNALLVVKTCTWARSLLASFWAQSIGWPCGRLSGQLSWAKPKYSESRID